MFRKLVEMRMHLEAHLGDKMKDNRLRWFAFIYR